VTPPAGGPPVWTTACPDWERRIVAGESLIPFTPLFPEEATDALGYFNALRMVDAPGSPTMGEVSRRWVSDFVASIFGAYDPVSGRRLITEYLMLIAKKNGKSTDAAGIMLTALLRNWRESAEFLILAPTIEIANNSFFPARDMVRKDAELNDLLHVQDHYRTITHRGTGAVLKIVAADNEAVSGKKATGVLIDELWLFGKKADAENMLREATGGLASRPEGFTIFLSTQSDEPPTGVFKQKLMYARGVRDGTIADKRFLPVLYEFPRAMLDSNEHLEPKNFYVTNPNLGASVDEEFLARELTKAQEAGPESLCGFLAKHLNVEIGLNLRSDRWVGADYWLDNAIEALTFDSLLERCEVVTVGIDGGGLDDLLGFTAVGREVATGDWLSWSKAWAHPIVLERRKKEAARLLDFAADGDLVIVEQIGDDVVEAAHLVKQIKDAGLLPDENAVGVDPAGIGGIVDALQEIAGLEPKQIIGIPQGWKMAGAIKTTERKLAGGTLKHGGRPLMAWCVGNAKVTARGNAILIEKQTCGSAKVDPLLALFNAVSLMSMNPAAIGRSFWQREAA
jgi:phage terminase large subunit-like protein